MRHASTRAPASSKRATTRRRRSSGPHENFIVAYLAGRRLALRRRTTLGHEQLTTYDLIDLGSLARRGDQLVWRHDGVEKFAPLPTASG